MFFEVTPQSMARSTDGHLFIFFLHVLALGLSRLALDYAYDVRGKESSRKK